MKKIIGLLGVFLFVVVCLVSCNAYILRTEVIASDGKKIALKAPASESIIKYGRYRISEARYFTLSEEYWDLYDSILGDELNEKLPPYPYKVIDTNTIEVTSYNIYGEAKSKFTMYFMYDDNGKLCSVGTDGSYVYYYEDEAQK